jgi:hypothetical protein
MYRELLKKTRDTATGLLVNIIECIVGIGIRLRDRKISVRFLAEARDYL